MTWKTFSPGRFSEFRRTYAWALKKNIGMTALLAVLLFLSLPLLLILEISGCRGREAVMTVAQQKAEIFERCQRLLKIAVPSFGVTLLLLFSVVLCVRLFGYMQNKRSADLFHSLPIGRVPMLLGRWCAGMTALVVPVLINFLILRLVLLSAGISPAVGKMSFAGAMLWLFLMTAGAFTFCTFFAVCSGSVMDTVLSVLGMNAGFPILLLLCLNLIRFTVPGTDFDFWASLAPVTLLAPFPAAYLPFAWNFSVAALPAWFLPWWICFTAALLAGACILYRRRRSETAEDASAFPIPKTAVRFLLTGCAGIGLGLALMNTGTAGFLVGVLAGSAVTHTIVEALYARGFSTLKKSAAWYAVFAVCFFVFYGVLVTGCFGYDTRVPSASEVENMSVFVDGDQRQYILTNTQSVEIHPVLKRPESIRTVLKLHKELCGWYRENNFPYTPQEQSSGNLIFQYRLKDGRTLTRRYFSVSRSNSLIEKDRETIMNLMEYRQGKDPVYYLQPSDMESFTVSADEKDSQTTVTDINEKEELLKALRKHCLDFSLSSESDSVNPYYVEVKWAKEITPNARLRDALGGYCGKIEIGPAQYAYRSGDDVDTAIRKMQAEWVKSKEQKERAEIINRIGKKGK